MNNAMMDAHKKLLLGIARETLGIRTFEPTGKITADFHLVSAEAIARALEAAYDAGLVVGHSVPPADNAALVATALPHRRRCDIRSGNCHYSAVKD